MPRFDILRLFLAISLRSELSFEKHLHKISSSILFFPIFWTFTLIISTITLTFSYFLDFYVNNLHHIFNITTFWTKNIIISTNTNVNTTCFAAPGKMLCRRWCWRRWNLMLRSTRTTKLTTDIDGGGADIEVPFCQDFKTVQFEGVDCLCFWFLNPIFWITKSE